MKRGFKAIATALVLLASGVVSAGADLVDAAAANGGAKTFAAAAKESGFSEWLKRDGPYTVFAPDDAAFDKLAPATRDALMKDKAKLAQVLAYHVIPGKIMVTDIKPGQVQTIQGGTVKISSDNGKVTVNEANVTQSDVVADNGVIHVIDTVVLPKD
ncbi:fasciclin domain-containing protein [Noviherbaspirillum cavernae]|uniref:Fasciclin domain-containing protein n=1 Tax=Noviherbaspirillum cavernae TaxID=2320862 RepID=A0A418X6B4_9BURK|nr:fasciclin domain-containing protein [Noviherbaspirillum cavernae]RJG07979.1 fasciclin domain-containing protein [Noviherbaspirillum cavernae]